MDELVVLKSRLFDAEEQLKQTSGLLDNLVSSICEVVGFDIQDGNVNLEDLISHIKELVAWDEVAEVENEQE